MEKAAKDSIRELVLKLRKTLEAEVERELGRYGIYANRKWIPAAELPRLAEQERELDRPRIEAVVHREQDAGLSREEAVVAFVRETAYTHLNRLLGLKCMEMRGLIKETITTRDIYSNRSQRHRDYLDENPQAHRDQDRGLVAMLQAAYAEVSLHIGVLFDPDSDYVVVWPRHTTLSDCIGWINALDEQVAGKLGTNMDTMTSVYADDTFLGWVYQYFQEEEKDRVFREVRTKKKKISGYDIIPATSLYTERYMVQFLVENSLGALWMEMYPDSDLCQGWDYFVEDPNLQNEDGTRRPGREPKPMAELTMLDPAGGSGHFLLYGFDLFTQMYEAEAQQQGKWADKVQIARDILRHNLYGIDIDLRSIQLSALNLYMKACVYAGIDLAGLRNHAPVQMNLVCADIVLQEGPELEELLQVFSDDPLTQELIRTLWHGLSNARELGSLLKIEEPLNELIERKRAREKGTWLERPQEMWDQWKLDLINRLRSLVKEATDSFEINSRMFSQETIKGTYLFDQLMRRYDVVTTNPPYLYQRNMGDELKNHYSSSYELVKYDLYAGFIQRCLELGKNDALIGLVTQHSYMFLSYYKKFRAWLLPKYIFRVAAHLGAGAFTDIGGEVVNVVTSVWRRRTNSDELASFVRLTDELDKGFALKRICFSPEESAKFYQLNQKYFSFIDGSPIAYWLPASFYEKLKKYRVVKSCITIPSRTTTTNNDRFVRFQWETKDSIGTSGSKWVLYTKGGGFRKWSGNLLWVVNWSEQARNYYQKHPVGRLTKRQHWFVEGITYSATSGLGFGARYIPPLCVYDRKGPSLIPKPPFDLYNFIGILNSPLSSYLLGLLNPTLEVQTGDISKLPVPPSNSNLLSAISKLAETCIALSEKVSSYDPTEFFYKGSCIEEAIVTTGAKTISDAYEAALAERESNISQILITEAEIAAKVIELYDLKEEADVIQGEMGIPVGAFPILGQHEKLTVLETRQKVTKYYTEEGLGIHEISAKLGVNPASIVAILRELKLKNDNDFRHEVENLLLHLIWRLCRLDEDGIIPYEKGLGDLSLLERIEGQIETLFGSDKVVNTEAEMNTILRQGGLTNWIKKPFAEKHSSQFQKRPILWQLTSPQQRFRALIYYHKLDRDTLPKVRSRYLGPLLTRARTELNNLHQHDPGNIKAIGELEEYIADLQDCDQRLESVIQGTVDVELPEWANGPYRHGRPPYDPDLDDGVYVNILPLQEAGLLPIKVV